MNKKTLPIKMSIMNFIFIVVTIVIELLTEYLLYIPFIISIIIAIIGIIMSQIVGGAERTKTVVGINIFLIIINGLCIAFIMYIYALASMWILN